MKCCVWWLRCALAIWLLVGLTACGPSSLGLSDDDKEPHYLEGKSLVNSMDYTGAVDAFKKSLKTNPDSAPAHIELALLYTDKVPDPAAAIYHYQCFLELRPNDAQAGWIRQRIENCKQDLAKTVLLPVSPGMQHDIEQLAEENKRLRDENQKWQALYASRNPGQSNPPPQTPSQLPVTPPRQPAIPGGSQAGSAGGTGTVVNHPPAGAPAARTHVVAAGETPSAIARKYNVRLEALMTANPNLDARHMRIGQTLNIPGQ
jgi:tetratricopeptide (TPR) repeat protein